MHCIRDRVHGLELVDGITKDVLMLNDGIVEAAKRSVKGNPS